MERPDDEDGIMATAPRPAPAPAGAASSVAAGPLRRGAFPAGRERGRPDPAGEPAAGERETVGETIESVDGPGTGPRARVRGGGWPGGVGTDG